MTLFHFRNFHFTESLTWLLESVARIGNFVPDVVEL